MSAGVLLRAGARPLFVQHREGRFWTPGKWHKGDTVALLAVAPDADAPPLYATHAVSKCGDVIEHGLLSHEEPPELSRCGRCWK